MSSLLWVNDLRSSLSVWLRGINRGTVGFSNDGGRRDLEIKLKVSPFVLTEIFVTPSYEGIYLRMSSAFTRFYLFFNWMWLVCSHKYFVFAMLARSLLLIYFLSLEFIKLPDWSLFNKFDFITYLFFDSTNIFTFYSDPDYYLTLRIFSILINEVIPFLFNYAYGSFYFLSTFWFWKIINGRLAFFLFSTAWV